MRSRSTARRKKSASPAAPAPTSRYRCGEYPVMSQYGMADEPGPFRPLGRRPAAHLPERGQRERQGRVRAGRHRHPSLLPLRASTRSGSRSARATSSSIEGGLDAALMREWLGEGKSERGRPRSLRRLAPRLGAQPAVPLGSLALNGDAPERSRAAARSFPGNFLFSTGPNTQGGGKRTHARPLRRADARLHHRARRQHVVEKGRIVDPKMRVARVAR